MLLKICLIIALITGLGAIGVGFLKVEPRIKQAESDLAAKTTELANETSAKAQVQKKLDDTTATLKKTSADLAQTKSDLDGKTKEADDANKKAQNLDGQLARTKKELETTIEQNQKFHDLHKTVEEIQKAFADLKDTTTERDVFTVENKQLQLEINRLRNALIKSSGSHAPSPLPRGLSGKVVAVDPKYDFLILSVGGREGALVHGQMIISRDGQMIGKVEITDVQANYSIANFLREGRKGDAIEGDTVLVQ